MFLSHYKYVIYFISSCIIYLDETLKVVSLYPFLPLSIPFLETNCFLSAL